MGSLFFFLRLTYGERERETLGVSKRISRIKFGDEEETEWLKGDGRRS